MNAQYAPFPHGRTDDRGIALYESPYGKLAHLPQRLAKWSALLRRPGGNVPFYGGLVADLEVVMQLLDLREFAQWLKINGPPEQSRWADEILAAIDRGDQGDELEADIERVLPVAEGETYAEVVDEAARKAVQFDAIRATLVNAGALAADDTGTDLPALLQALLS